MKVSFALVLVTLYAVTGVPTELENNQETGAALRAFGAGNGCDDSRFIKCKPKKCKENNYMYNYQYCPKTCGKCKQKECKDVYRQCPHWKPYCYSPVYAYQARKICPKTCGVCGGKGGGGSSDKCKNCKSAWGPCNKPCASGIQRRTCKGKICKRTCNSHIPCNPSCTTSASLGAKAGGSLPDTAFKSPGTAIHPLKPRLWQPVGPSHAHTGWIPEGGVQYLQVDLGAVKIVSGFQVQGGSNCGFDLYTQKFKFGAGLTENSITIIQYGGIDKEFIPLQGPNIDAALFIGLDEHVTGRYVRFYTNSAPREYGLRVDIFGCPMPP